MKRISRPAGSNEPAGSLFSGEALTLTRCQRSAPTEGDQPKNYRNGYSRKKVKTQLGEIDIKVPRDRNGSFEGDADKILDKILDQIRLQEGLHVHI